MQANKRIKYKSNVHKPRDLAGKNVETYQHRGEMI